MSVEYWLASATTYARIMCEAADENDGQVFDVAYSGFQVAMVMLQSHLDTLEVLP